MCEKGFKDARRSQRGQVNDARVWPGYMDALRRVGNDVKYSVRIGEMERQSLSMGSHALQTF